MKNIFQSLFCFAVFFVALCSGFSGGAAAQTIIRDTEIEKIMQGWFAPIYKAAGVAPESVNIVIVQSPQINAFVAGGANMFFYTGLIEKTDGPDELIGVFAHELGHIQGGHLISQQGAAQRASYESILGTVLGVGAAILTGDSRAAAALSTVGSGIAASNYLAHSRINESSADQAALSYFDEAKKDPEGLITFFEKLRSEEFLPASQQSEFMRTHPLTSNRLDTVRRARDNSPHIGQKWPDEWSEQHARIKAKLIAYTNPGRIPWIFDDRDQSVAARYARAVAAYRENRIDEALNIVNGLIAQESDNPYFYELKGQMLVDFSRLDEGIAAYQKSLSVLPDAPLIRMAMGHAMLAAAKSDDEIRAAIKELERVRSREQRSAQLHRLLGTAYGRLGQEDVAKVYLAEEALLLRRYPLARAHAEKALKTLPENSAEAIRAQDVLNFVGNIKEEKTR